MKFESYSNTQNWLPTQYTDSNDFYVKESWISLASEAEVNERIRNISEQLNKLGVTCFKMGCELNNYLKDLSLAVEFMKAKIHTSTPTTKEEEK